MAVLDEHFFAGFCFVHVFFFCVCVDFFIFFLFFSFINQFKKNTHESSLNESSKNIDQDRFFLIYWCTTILVFIINQVYQMNNNINNTARSINNKLSYYRKRINDNPQSAHIYQERMDKLLAERQVLKLVKKKPNISPATNCTSKHCTYYHDIASCTCKSIDVDNTTRQTCLCQYSTDNYRGCTWIQNNNRI